MDTPSDATDDITADFTLTIIEQDAVINGFDDKTEDRNSSYGENSQLANHYLGVNAKGLTDTEENAGAVTLSISSVTKNGTPVEKTDYFKFGEGDDKEKIFTVNEIAVPATGTDTYIITVTAESAGIANKYKAQTKSATYTLTITAP